VRICTSPVDPAWFATLSPRLKLVLGPGLSNASLHLSRSADLVGLMDEMLPPLVDQDIDAACILAERQLFHGRFDEATALLGSRVSPEALPLIGWLHVAQGRHADGLEVFELLLATLRRQTRKRNLALRGLPGVLHLLALLRHDETADLERVTAQVNAGLRVPMTDVFEYVFRMVGELANVLAGRSRAPLMAWIHRIPVSGRLFDLLFQCLVLHWLGERPSLDSLKELAGRGCWCQLACLGRRRAAACPGPPAPGAEFANVARGHGQIGLAAHAQLRVGDRIGCPEGAGRDERYQVSGQRCDRRWAGSPHVLGARSMVGGVCWSRASRSGPRAVAGRRVGRSHCRSWPIRPTTMTI
jgi:hypothetical protein